MMKIKVYMLQLIAFSIMFFIIPSCKYGRVKTVSFLHTQAVSLMGLDFIKKEYEQEYGEFSIFYNKSTESYIKKWVKQHPNQQFKPFDKLNLENIPVKKKINIKFRFSHSTPIYSTDSIDIYINNQIFISGRYPARLDYAWEMKDLAPYPERNLVSEQDGTTRICIISHSQRVYCDTIVPLQYKDIDIIRDGKGFQFRFWGIK